MFEIMYGLYGNEKRMTEVNVFVRHGEENFTQYDINCETEGSVTNCFAEAPPEPIVEASNSTMALNRLVDSFDVLGDVNGIPLSYIIFGFFFFILIFGRRFFRMIDDISEWVSSREGVPIHKKILLWFGVAKVKVE